MEEVLTVSDFLEGEKQLIVSDTLKPYLFKPEQKEGDKSMSTALKELMDIDRDWLTPEDISDILGSNPATIRLTVKEHPEWFSQYCPFWTGNRLKFPKSRFIWCMTGGENVGG